MIADLVTVVIPVYRTENYLHRCVSSVMAQTYRDLQILLVDDGSPDDCPRLCDEWAKRDSRITAIHKKNAGLGMARNTGLEYAEGEYICFLDSDDFLAPEAIAHALQLARREKADITMFGFVNVGAAEKELSRRIPKPERSVYRGREVQEELLPVLLAGSRETGLYMSVCWALFSMETVRKAAWRFPSEREIISEDIYALLGLYRSVDTAAILPEALYYYRKNDASLTRIYRADRFEKAKYFYQECLKLCRELGYPQKVLDNCREPFLSLTIAAMKQEGKGLRAILDDTMLQEALQGITGKGWKKRILYWAMGRKRYVLCRWLLAAKKHRERRK